jgi:hypothetical protein
MIAASEGRDQIVRTAVLVPSIVGPSAGLMFVAALIGCSSGMSEKARDCGVTESQLRGAMEAVSEMKPYTGQKIGQCELLVDDAGNVSVTTPPQRSDAAKAIARDRAKARQ